MLLDSKCHPCTIGEIARTLRFLEQVRLICTFQNLTLCSKFFAHCSPFTKHGVHDFKSQTSPLLQVIVRSKMERVECTRLSRHTRQTLELSSTELDLWLNLLTTHCRNRWRCFVNQDVIALIGITQSWLDLTPTQERAGPLMSFETRFRSEF